MFHEHSIFEQSNMEYSHGIFSSMFATGNSKRIRYWMLNMIKYIIITLKRAMVYTICLLSGHARLRRGVCAQFTDVLRLRSVHRSSLPTTKYEQEKRGRRFCVDVARCARHSYRRQFFSSVCGWASSQTAEQDCRVNSAHGRLE